MQRKKPASKLNAIIKSVTAFERAFFLSAVCTVATDSVVAFFPQRYPAPREMHQQNLLNLKIFFHVFQC